MSALQFAGLCFATTLVASLMGFGGVMPVAVEATKGLAVVSLLLFCAGLYRGLYTS